MGASRRKAPQDMALLRNVAANQIIPITEGNGIVSRVPFAR